LLLAAAGPAQARTLTFWPREGQATNWPFVTVNTDRQFPADPAHIHLLLDGAPLDWASRIQNFGPTSLYLCAGTLRGWGSHGPIVEDFADGPHVFGITLDENDGSTTTASLSFVVDRSPPQFAVDTTSVVTSSGAIWLPGDTLSGLALAWQDGGTDGATDGSGMNPGSFELLIDRQWVDGVSDAFQITSTGAVQVQPLTFEPGLHTLDFEISDNAWNRAVAHIDLFVGENAPEPVRVVPPEDAVVGPSRNNFWMASAAPGWTAELFVNGESAAGRGYIESTPPNVQQGWFWQMPPDGPGDHGRGDRSRRHDRNGDLAGDIRLDTADPDLRRHARAAERRERGDRQSRRGAGVFGQRGWR